MNKKLGRKKKKYWTKKDKVYSILIVGLIVIPLFFVIRYNAKNRHEKLNSESFTTYGTIEKLRPNVSKGKTTRQDVVYFYFIKNDTVFHKLEQLTLGGIDRLGIKMNYCFEMKVVKTDYGIFDIDFKKRKDTLIDKKKYQNQKYNTFIHKNIIE
ncbi:MAG: hypothetical protein ACJA2M_001570 [Polaribacter sp.]